MCQRHTLVVCGPERGEQLLVFALQGQTRALEVWDVRSATKLATLCPSFVSASFRMLDEGVVRFTAANNTAGVYDVRTGVHRTLPFSEVSDRLELGRRLFVISKEECLYLDMDASDQVTRVDVPRARRFHLPRLLQAAQGSATLLVDLVTGWRTVVPEEVDACCVHSGHLFYATHRTPMRGLLADRTVMIEHTVHAVSVSDPKAQARTLLKVTKPVRKHFKIGFMAPQPFEGHEPIVTFDDELYTLSL